ncbi:MAG TPA: hypothetical protein DDY98_05295 [Ruminococcaceae bacterium]|nr:hypothetical protein [Oscillospiraceae bacterium]
MVLTTQNGKADKIHISVDGEYRFTVDADFWYMSGYLDGDEIDEDALLDLERRIRERRCFNRALNILSRREHSEKELTDKLVRADGAVAAAAAVERVKQLGYLDDARYATMLASELSQRKGMSQRGIFHELLRRGVDRETAEEALGEQTLDECDKIKMLLQGKYRNRLSDEKGRRQVFNALLRLGYSYSQVRSAMQDYDSEYSQEDD